MATPSSICSPSLLALAILCSTCSCLQFSYPSFDETNSGYFSFTPGSGVASGSLQITPSSGDITNRSVTDCYTRAMLKLRSSSQKHLTSFRTEFVLNILPHPQNKTGGEGMAFVLTNNPPSLPRSSSPANGAVAVELYTGKVYAEDLDGNRVGPELLFNDVSASTPTASYPRRF